MERNLSSRFTTLWKFIFPTYWLGFASFATYTAWFRPELWHDRGSPWERWGTLAALLYGAVLLVPHAVKMCHVRLDEDELIISNYWREVHIPFTAIAGVEYRPMKGPPRVTLTFRWRTTLGRQVIFIPNARSIDELVADLRARAELPRAVDS